jgi:hypothetical protein
MKNLILLFLAALGLRIAFAILFQYDGLYGQDPFAYYDYTAVLREVWSRFCSQRCSGQELNLTAK